MTQLSIFMNPSTPAVCEPVQYEARGVAAYATAAVVYSLSGATLFLLATFIRSL
jgi:hypothetical protein